MSQLVSKLFASFESHFLQPTWSYGDVSLEWVQFEFPLIKFILVLLNFNHLDLLKKHISAKHRVDTLNIVGNMCSFWREGGSVVSEGLMAQAIIRAGLGSEKPMHSIC